MTAHEKLSDRVNLVLKNIREKDHTHEGLAAGAVRPRAVVRI